MLVFIIAKMMGDLNHGILYVDDITIPRRQSQKRRQTKVYAI